MSEQLTTYSVWDKTTRWFHWINVICIVGLIAIGLIIFNAKTLGIHGEAKVLLKVIHVYIGYVFVLNLAWRLIWAFIGNRYARWGSLLPVDKNLLHKIKDYRQNNTAYAGHNPLAKLMISFLLIMMLAQAATGLVLAGTDIYYPPFGSEIAEWVAKEGVDPDSLILGDKSMLNADEYQAMRDFRKPFITIHKWAFYLLLIAIVLHIAAVVMTDIREKSGLISAMFTGQKVFAKKPIDID
ncbi:cytochrome b/b6 domain-containing protein [Candidatus Albibeggiatoa sp. nov. NOAA]|uniref:cytochrome b/b6 domain-containing protein n=1 Tax=Candidatus Albibeggiatoa sp. nov. NOAA TaxID=3162724 RepID=UPI0032FFF48D|nr:cytochrome b/b6 domain-containing protein [Thiotrichaceae bacterium]